MIRKIQLDIVYIDCMFKTLSFTLRANFSASYLKYIEELHHQKKFHQIFGIKGAQLGRPNISKGELRKIYISLIKKYHSDKCQDDPEKSKQYQQISKIIISAYNNIEKLYFSDEKYKNEYEIEDQICMTKFNKKYSEARYWMYQKGNQKVRQQFLDELSRRTGETYYKSYSSSPNQFHRQKRASPLNPKPNFKKEQSSSLPMMGIGAAIALGAIYLLMRQKNQPSLSSKSDQKKQIDYTEKIKQIGYKLGTESQKKANEMRNSLLKDQPPCLKYPRQTQPHLFQQLTEYSIAPDIHLFEVPSNYFRSQIIDNVHANSDAFNQSEFLRLNRIKPNTALTLSLQAQRALHNVYVKVKDVIRQIEQKGRYNPPKIFLRFHGYLMFEIRDMPISLKNYKDTDYISLFDLYFNYYSPIFLKKDQYSQYLVGKDEPELFGWVHLNNRKCKPIYLQKNQKYAFFISERSKDWEDVYRNIWDNFYKKYEHKWMPGGNKL